jgi:hypothetical protein
VSFLPLKTCLKNFVRLDVSRVTGFPEFPNSSPSGKLVDSDDPIPRILRKFSKKRHPRNVGGDTRRPETLERLDRGGFRGTTPPGPINRRPSLLKNFTTLLVFTIRESVLLAESRLLLNCSRSSWFLRISLRYYLISLFQFLVITFLRWHLCSMNVILEYCSYCFACVFVG